MTRSALFVAALMAIALAVAWPSLWTAVDDAFISARYAEHLVTGHGWTYNAGEPAVEGFTNPLWTAWIAVGLLLGAPAHTWMVSWGLIGWLAAIPGAWVLANSVTDDDGDGTLLAPALLATSPLLSVAATNGLETAWFLTAILWCSAAVLRLDQRWDPGVGAALGALAWIRPEGLLVGLVWIGFRAWEGRSWRSLLAGWAAVLAVLVGWRWWTFGALVPNTASAKVGAGGWAWIVERNTIYLRRDSLTWPVVAAVVLVGSLWPALERRRLALGVLAVALTLPALCVELWMPGGRLLTPAYVLAAVLLGSHVGRRPRVAAGLAVAGVVSGLALNHRARVQDRAHSVLPDNQASQMATRISDRAPQGAVAVVRDAGLFAYTLGPGITVYESHEHGLTRATDHPPPANPEIVVVTQNRENARGVRYPADKRALDALTVPYEYAGRFHQHRHRFYDVYIRVDGPQP